MRMENENVQPDRITYSESRSINIGNYEKVDIFISYGSNLKKFNQVDKTITIFHSESVTMEEEKEAFNETAKKLMLRVKGVLDKREKDIRIKSEDHVDFNTRNKI